MTERRSRRHATHDMTYSLGIDLGTTFTAAAVVRSARAEVVTLSYRTTSIPTVVALTEDGEFVIGDTAERRALGTPERVAREFKRRVGDPVPVLLGGTPVSVDRLLAEVLRHVHRTVSATEGAPPASTVVTHPANWGAFKQDVLVQALRQAEIDHASLLPEPVAAATWYAASERLAPGATVAVYDLGGGTFDAAVLEMGVDGRFVVRGRPEGIERLGGIDVDAAVMGHVLRVLGPAADRLDPTDAAITLAMAQLRRECVEAKEALSAETSVSIPVMLPSHRENVLLHRRELEDLIGPLLGPTTEALARAVASAELPAGRPGAVLLVGGASRMPLIAREVTTALGLPVAVDAHPKHPVALGAALVAAARAPAPAAVPAALPSSPAPPPTSPPASPSPPPAGWGPAASPSPPLPPPASPSPPGWRPAAPPGPAPSGPPVRRQAPGAPPSGPPVRRSAPGASPSGPPIRPRPPPSGPPPGPGGAARRCD
ncbi:MAG TPA: Hsp70 family protein, partial [Acidimicrobiales bacterium]|nr:Hsp70 family protein [Acidimicrobiales bacterium]